MFVNYYIKCITTAAVYVKSNLKLYISLNSFIVNNSNSTTLNNYIMRNRVIETSMVLLSATLSNSIESICYN